MTTVFKAPKAPPYSGGRYGAFMTLWDAGDGALKTLATVALGMASQSGPPTSEQLSAAELILMAALPKNRMQFVLQAKSLVPLVASALADKIDHPAVATLVVKFLICSSSTVKRHEQGDGTGYIGEARHD